MIHRIYDIDVVYHCILNSTKRNDVYLHFIKQYQHVFCISKFGAVIISSIDFVHRNCEKRIYLKKMYNYTKEFELLVQM